MASNGHIALVVDGTSFKDRFGGTENVLDRPKCLIDVSHCLGFICVGVIRQFIVLREEKNPGTKL
jgi:hypothetical protein